MDLKQAKAELMRGLIANDCEGGIPILIELLEQVGKLLAEKAPDATGLTAAESRLLLSSFILHMKAAEAVISRSPGTVQLLIMATAVADQATMSEWRNIRKGDITVSTD